MTGTPVYSLVDDSDGKFAIVGNTIVVAAPLDYETATSHTVTVAVSGLVPAVANKTFTIDVINVIDTLIVLTGASVPENSSIGTTVGTFSLPSASGTPVWSLVDDAGGKFSVDGAVLEVAGSLDYETAGYHNVTVAVTGVTPTFENRTFTITVTDVTLAAIVLSNNQLAENAEPGDIIGEVSVPEGTGTYVFTITADPDEMFDLDSVGAGKEGSLDYESQATHTVTIQADNSIDPVLTQTFTINVVDVTADDEMRQPVVSSLSPLNNATGVALTSNLTITFDTTVQFGSGNIDLYDVNDTLIESFDVTTDVGTGPGTVSLSGTVLTINPTASMLENTRYYVLIDPEVIDDLVGNSFQGFIINSMWTWVASASSAPGIFSFFPADNSTDVNNLVTLVVTFHEDVELGASGTVYVKKTSDNSVVDSWNVATDEGSGAGQVEITNDNEMTLHLSADLDYEIQYYVVWDAGVVQDMESNHVAALSSTTAWSFTTESNALLLDDYTLGSVYSLRKLVLAYAGDCVRIRRSSDNTEEDFGFTGELIDAAGIATFVGVGSGYIVTWYDQSGNSVDLTQATAANQPLYVASGINSLPTVRFDGTNDNLAKTSVAIATLTNADETTMMMVLEQLGSDTQNAQVQWVGTGSSVTVQFTYSGGGYWGFGDTNILPSGGRVQWNPGVTGWADTPRILELYRSTGDLQDIIVDGVPQLIGGTPETRIAQPTGTGTFEFGGTSGTYFGGDLSEFIWLKTDIGSTERAVVREDMADFYGVTL